MCVCACKSSSSPLPCIFSWYQSLVVAVRSFEKQAEAAELHPVGYTRAGANDLRLRSSWSPDRAAKPTAQSFGLHFRGQKSVSGASRPPFFRNSANCVLFGKSQFSAGLQVLDYRSQIWLCRTVVVATVLQRSCWVYVCKLRSQVVTDLAIFSSLQNCADF